MFKITFYYAAFGTLTEMIYSAATIRQARRWAESLAPDATSITVERVRS